MTADVLRTFISVHVRAERSLVKILEALAAMGRPLKAIAAEQLHVTPKFLGDTRVDAVKEISRVVGAAAVNETAFELRIVGLGAFPRPDRPTVIWAGLVDGSGTLKRLAEALENQLEPLGFPREHRPFEPHLTLARVKSKPPGQLFDLLRSHQGTEFGTATIASVCLMRSELTPAGSRYAVLAEKRLQAEG